MKSRKLRVGVIGTGGIARACHMPAWQRIEDAEIVAAADIDKSALAAAVEKFGVPNAFTDYRKLLAMKEVDVVDVCTWNSVHAPAAIASLAAGKHVICEKPLAITPAEVNAMIRAAKKARRLLCTIQNHRFRPESQALKHFITAGHLGEAYYARCWAIRRALLPPGLGFITMDRSGGGPCLDIGVHVLDVTMWLMGLPDPVSVSGVSQRNLAHTRIIPGHWGDWDRRKYSVEDFAVGLVRFRNGATLTLEASWLGHTPKMEEFCSMILGPKAGVAWPQCDVYSADGGSLIDSTLKPKPIPYDGHEAELRAFADAVVNHKPAPVSPEESLKIIRILDGIYRSQKAGKEVRV